MPANKRNFEPIDELRYAQMDTASFSPDGTKVVYTVRRVDLEKEKEFCHLWLHDLSSGITRQLTRGEHSNSAPVWSPDGKTIAFLSTRSEKPQIFTISPFFGEAIRLTDVKQGVGSGPLWSPDGRHIAFTVSPLTEPRKPELPYRVTRAGYRMDGVGYLDDAVQHTYVVPVRYEMGVWKAGEPKQLTNEPWMDEILAWSPDGQELLVASLFEPESMAIFSARMRIVNLNGEKTGLLDEKWGMVSTAAWLPDGQRIALYGLPDKSPGGTKGDLWVYDRRTGQLDCRSKSFKYGFESFKSKLLVVDENKALCTVYREGMGEVYEFSLSGEPAWKSLVTGQRTCAALDLKQGKLLFAVSLLHNPSELFTADLQTGAETQITHHNEEWLEEINIPEVERFTFPNSQGVQIEGWFLKPADGKLPCPAVLCIHGTTADAKDACLGVGGHPGGSNGIAVHLCKRGFVTMAPDHFCAGQRAPKEHAPYDTTEFYERHPNWSEMGKDVYDHQQALDVLCAMDAVDSQHIGCIGHSLGGYGTVFLAAMDERVQAAVSSCGITSWLVDPARDNWSRTAPGRYKHFPLLRPYFEAGRPAPLDFHEIMAAIAPRALLNLSAVGNDSCFPIFEPFTEIYCQVERVYKALGAEGRFACFFHSEKHSFNAPSRALAYRWLEVQLGLAPGLD